MTIRTMRVAKGVDLGETAKSSGAVIRTAERS
jgi:hypothetical protein